MAFQNGQIVKTKDLLSFFSARNWGRGGQGHSLRHDTYYYRHSCLVSWKRGVKVGRLAGRHPLGYGACRDNGLTSDAQAGLDSHFLPLFLAEVMKKAIEDEGIIS